MLKLTFITPGFQGQTAELYEGTTKVGRAQENSLIVCDNSVSSHHCEIVVNGDGVAIRDLGSANGCFVNGSPIHGLMPVGDGDTIKFGNIAARLQEVSNEEVYSTEWTAVHHHSKTVKDQVKAPKAGEGFPTIIAPAKEFLAADQTIVTPRPPPPPAPTLGATEPDTKSTNVPLWAIILLVAIVSAVCWWIVSR